MGIQKFFNNIYNMINYERVQSNVMWWMGIGLYHGAIVWYKL